jgi:hypothetical protein
LKALKARGEDEEDEEEEAEEEEHGRVDGKSDKRISK